MIQQIETIIKSNLPGFHFKVWDGKLMGVPYIGISIAASDYNISRVIGQWPQRIGLKLDPKTMDLRVANWAGMGGQSIYRKVNKDDPKERYLAMVGERIPFRTPNKTEKDVLRAIELFCINYKKKLLEHLPNLQYTDAP